MSAAEVIERIKELPPREQAQVVRFIVENAGPLPRSKCAITKEADGLPVIQANGGTITSELVHEIESRIP